MDEAALQVLDGEEVVLSFTQIPSFQELASQLQPHSTLKYFHPASNEFQYIENEEDLTAALETGSPGLQLFLSYPQSPEPETFSCPFCQTVLPTSDSLCPDCQTENWDAWFIEKYGKEAWTKYQEEGEPRPKLAAAFSFGPSRETREQERKDLDSEEGEQPIELTEDDRIQRDSTEQEEKQVSVPAKEEEKTPKEPDHGVKKSDHGSLLEFDSQPDSTRDFPQQEESAVDRILEARERDRKLRVEEDEGLEDLKEADLDSPESRGNVDSRRFEEVLAPHQTDSPVGERVPSREYPMTSSYRGGLASSPYLSPESKDFHNRKYCKICQSKSSQLSLRYSESVSQRDFSSPRYRNPPFSQVQSSRISSSRPLVRPTFASSYQSPSQWYRSSFVLPKERENLQKCYYCSQSFPWYQETCGKCEVRKSLMRQPESDYKRKVMQWC